MISVLPILLASLGIIHAGLAGQAWSVQELGQKIRGGRGTEYFRKRGLPDGQADFQWLDGRLIFNDSEKT